MRYVLPIPRPYVVKHDVCVAMNFCSVWKRDFWQQWLLCFSDIEHHVEDLFVQDNFHLPDDIRSFSYCLHHHFDAWGTTDSIMKELSLLEHGRSIAFTLCKHIQCLSREKLHCGKVGPCGRLQLLRPLEYMWI